MKKELSNDPWFGYGLKDKRGKDIKRGAKILFTYASGLQEEDEIIDIAWSGTDNGKCVYDIRRLSFKNRGFYLTPTNAKRCEIV